MPAATASLMPRTPSVATAPPTDATVRKSRLPLFNVSVIASSLVNRSIAGIDQSLAARTSSSKKRHPSRRGSQLVLFECHWTTGLQARSWLGARNSQLRIFGYAREDCATEWRAPSND